LATQNPIEQEGTYPLPEAQLDRFLFNIVIDYPQFEEEVAIVKSTTSAYTPDLKKVLNSEEIKDLQNLVRRVPASDHVISYAVNLVRNSRPTIPEAPQFVRDWVNWGSGPRGSQYLILGGKARAILNGRYTVSIDDVRALARPVLRHRILTNFNAEAEGVTSLAVIDRLLETVKPEL
ncbi:MAG: MoxR family ATPase, partial [Candidatus Tectomicrobia bacterium]|nr:MoxR family ATPase [Candidatus Tectomicrobia bacterium]